VALALGKFKNLRLERCPSSHRRGAELVAFILINASHFLMNQLKEDNYLKTKKSQGSPCDFEKGCLYLIVVLRATTFHNFSHSRQKRWVLEIP
jgi:hypothetical protein